MHTSAELRKNFLLFFEARGHTVTASDSLIPSGDPTVLFTSAGMNQFKDYFLGRRADLTRAASCQKCLRTGDLDNVGKTPSHHSFFEMLGNFSFGDYFKKEAIAWAWEFLTGTTDYAGKHPSKDRALCVGLPAGKLWVSIYEDDEEAASLWRALGVPADRIKRFGQKDNFWPANAPKEGPNGPCGPCSEIYYGPQGVVDGPKSVEVWNLVFTQFDRQSDGSLKKLPKGNIDTGMGLERLTRVVQGVETDYETDLFAPIIAAIRALPCGKKGKPNQAVFAERAIADHIRAIVFLIADGVRPSNESRGYVLRMLIRRAYRLGRSVLRVQFKENVPPGSVAVVPKGWAIANLETFLFKLVDSVCIAMTDSPYHGELSAKRRIIEQVVQEEETQFVVALRSGTARFEELLERLKATGDKVVPGEEAFRLYDTYGFPLELTNDMAEEQGLTVDRVAFEASLKAQQERSRAGSQFTGGVFVDEALKIREAIKSLPAKDEQFLGYDALKTATAIKGLWDGTRWASEAREGQSVGIVLERSPFYGEAGGQIGDAGVIEGSRGRADVGQTTWIDDVLVHHSAVSQGTLKVQDPVNACVNAERRLKVSRSHTATHLLHWALRKVLGPEAVQGGSYNEAERLRFDFSSRRGLDDEQRQQVEALVNSRVRLADAVHTAQMSQDEAKRDGALALFGEKYGSTVRVVTIGDYSKELCGGTHLPHTGFLGAFTITGESAVAAGTRRIEALVGEAATARQQQDAGLLHDAARCLSRPAQELMTGLEELLEQLKRSERERKALQLELAKVEAHRLVAEGKSINGIMFIAAMVKHADRELLAALADAVKNSLKQDGVVLLASGDQGQVSVVVAATPNLVKRIHAGQLLKAIAPLVQGSGGGRPEFAQGGGKDPAGIPAALKRAEEIVRQSLESART